MTTPTRGTAGQTLSREANAALYQRFLEAFNNGDYDAVRSVLAPTFTDHHPGFGASSADEYLVQLRAAHDSLGIRGEAEDILVSGDHVTTRVRLSSTNVGAAMGIPATGGKADWGTIEIWRVSDGRLAERWARDDLLGLRAQLDRDADNIALARRVSEVVNARDYDALDELFAPDFVDHNPAWSVRSLDELKGILRSAAAALDFRAGLDDLFAADGDRVIMQITFTGRHIGPFFGQAPTGKEVEWTSTEVYRIAGGKVAERWTQADTTGLMRRLGVPLPE